MEKQGTAIWQAMSLEREARRSREAAVLHLNLAGIYTRQDLMRADITVAEAIALSPLLPEVEP